MKQILAILINEIPCCIMAAGAVTLAYNGISGWGWFIFGAILLSGTYKFKSGGSSNDSQKEST